MLLVLKYSAPNFLMLTKGFSYQKLSMKARPMALIQQPAQRKTHNAFTRSHSPPFAGGIR